MTSTVATPATKGGRQAPETSDRAKAESRLAAKLVAPALVVMLVVTAFPILRALWLSFYNYSLTAPEDKEFVGLSNYLTALTDGLFWRDIGMTVIYMVVTVGVELVIGFIFAMVMHRVIFARGVIRTSILIPYGIITVVSGFAWQFAFSNTNGFVNSWLPFVNADFNWFGQYWSSMIAIMASEIWKTTPFISLLLLAGLAQVPGELTEAAEVDGATWWQRMRRVIIPNMKAAIMVAVLFRALDAFRIFDNVFIMTNGAYGTEVLSLLAYRTSITRLEIGMGSAVSVLLFVCVIIICFIAIKLFKVDLTGARGGN